MKKILEYALIVLKAFAVAVVKVTELVRFLLSWLPGIKKPSKLSNIDKALKKAGKNKK